MKTKKTKRAPRKKTATRNKTFKLGGVIPFAIGRESSVIVITPAGNHVATTAGAVYDRLKPPFGTLEEGVNIVTNALRQDAELYESYKANIAMAFYDECARRAPGFMIDLQIVSTIANKAAADFLEMWIGAVVQKNPAVSKMCENLKEPYPVASASIDTHARNMQDFEDSKTFKITDEIKENIKKSFDAPLKTPMNVVIKEEPDLYDAVRSFRDDHTGPALMNKFLKDVADHVPINELPSMASEIIAAFSASALTEQNKRMEKFSGARKDLEEVEVTVKKMQSILNNKIQ